MYTSDSFNCTCKDGYEGDGFNCTGILPLFFPFDLLNSINFSNKIIIIYEINLIDVDECLLNNGGCDPNSNCTNTIGSRLCHCNDGYSGNGTNCLGKRISSKYKIK